MSMSLQQILDTSRRVINHQRRIFSFFVAIVLPACIALWTSDVLGEWHKTDSFLWGAILSFLISAQVVFAFVLLWHENLIEDTYFHAKKMSDQVLELEKEKLEISDTVQYYSVFSEVVNYWLRIESNLREKETLTPENIKEFFDDMFATIIGLGEVLFSFKYQELWNFSIYVYDTQTHELKPYWRKKHAKHPSQTDGRCWKAGEGHVGTAFARKKAVITSDATIDEVKDLSSAPENLRHDYDYDAYQSFAAIPIMCDNEDPVGVLVATSNIPGRFNKLNSQILNTAAVFLYNFLIKYSDVRK